MKGVVDTGCDGDQPGVQTNLMLFVRSIGLRPLVAGNIKGLQDRYRNPTTQAGFAKQWGQTPNMLCPVADGTKIPFEQALVDNATGMQVAPRHDRARARRARRRVPDAREEHVMTSAQERATKPVFGGRVRFVDTLQDAVAAVHAVVVMTRWEHFRRLPEVLRAQGGVVIVVDGRRLIAKDDVDGYEGIGL